MKRLEKNPNQTPSFISKKMATWPSVTSKTCLTVIGFIFWVNVIIIHVLNKVKRNGRCTLVVGVGLLFLFFFAGNLYPRVPKVEQLC